MRKPAGYTEAFFNLTGEDGGDPERVAGIIATPGLFSTLGAYPILGRAFTPKEGLEGRYERGMGPVIISHA